jgi:ornithine cyclodeaminase
MLILTNRDVHEQLSGNEADVLAAVRAAYLQYAAGACAVPRSAFLRFPGSGPNRIIALPAYLGGGHPVAGVKWIASFPANIERGIERASAVMILNSMQTGQPLAVIEASDISARRTGASAALAAQLLATERDTAGVTLIGCGVINFEVLRFLAHVHPELSRAVLHDVDQQRADRFARRCAAELHGLSVRFEADAAAALAGHSLVSVATTATAPHLDTRLLAPGTLVLHVSLRDILPAAVLRAVNVVDDADHVCTAETSLDLAERLSGGRKFITATIGDLARTGAGGVRDPGRVTIFSPFGLGVLDLAVAALALRGAEASGTGTRLGDFLPQHAAIASAPA